MKFVQQIVLATLLVGVASSASAISFTEAKSKAGKFCKDHKTALIVTGSVVGTLLAATGLFFGARYVNKNGMPFFPGSTVEGLIKSGFAKLPAALSGNAVASASSSAAAAAGASSTGPNQLLRMAVNDSFPSAH